MSESDRSESQKAKHLAEIAARYLRGETQAAIADSLGVSQSTVSRDLRELRAFWRESAIRDFDELVAEQLAKIDALEAEYWQAWQRSLKVKETIRNESGENDKGPWTKTITSREVLIGESSYLAGVERCIAARCKLLGLDKPAKSEVEISSNEGLSKETIETIKSKILGIEPQNLDYDSVSA